MVQSTLQTSREVVFLGYINEDTNYILINHIILPNKYFLYSKRDNLLGTNFESFKAFIKNINKIENVVAKKQIINEFL